MRSRVHAECGSATMPNKILRKMPINSPSFLKKCRNIEFGTYMNLESHSFITIDNLAQGTPDWHDWRKTVIGASDAPSIMGENPWKSKNALIEEKLGSKSAFSGNYATRRGTQLEPEARNVYQQSKNKRVTPAILQCRLRPWQAASVDGINLEQRYVVEIKCGVKSYEYTEKTGEVPVYYKAQLQHILSITGFESIDYFSYLPGKEPIYILVRRDDEYINSLITREKEFVLELSARGHVFRSTLKINSKTFLDQSNARPSKTYNLPNGDVFEGTITDGIKNGFGVYRWASGIIYEGSWLENQPHGTGKLVWPNGEVYEGVLFNNTLTGRGTFYCSNGDRYEGDFQNGSKTGQGIFYWVNGDRYVGEFIEGRRTGKGIKFLANGDRYEGEFTEDWLYDGIIIFNDGSRYEGECVANKFDGKGIYRSANGDWFEGSFSDGKKHGQGILICKNGQRMEGYFSNDEFSGPGILTDSSGIRYEGNFIDGKIHGPGSVFYEDKSQIDAHFQLGYAVGKGIQRWHDGTSYSGDFRANKPNGSGCIFWMNGDTFGGEFSDGLPHGRGTLRLHSGQDATVIWNSGKVSSVVSTSLLSQGETKLTSQIIDLEKFVLRNFASSGKKRKSLSFSSVVDAETSRGLILDFEEKISQLEITVQATKANLLPNFLFRIQSAESYRSFMIENIYSIDFISTATKLLDSCESKLSRLVIDYENHVGSSVWVGR